MCFLSVYVLFLGCYVSLVHTQWAWNPAGMCLIWKFYPLGLVNSNRRLRTVLQCRQECGNGKSSAQRQHTEPRWLRWKVPLSSGSALWSCCLLLFSSVGAGRWGLASSALLSTLSTVPQHSVTAASPGPRSSRGTVRGTELPASPAAEAMPRQALDRDCWYLLKLEKMEPWPVEASTLYFFGRGKEYTCWARPSRRSVSCVCCAGMWGLRNSSVQPAGKCCWLMGSRGERALQPWLGERNERHFL